MMQLIDSNGIVLLEREKPRAMRASTLSLRAKRLSHGIKKTVRPVLICKKEFLEERELTQAFMEHSKRSMSDIIARYV